MVVKTYRGRLADGAQDRIPLRTKDGSIGYRIVKFEIMPEAPGTVDYESGVSIWKTSQSSISTATLDINFSDTDLLAAAYMLVAAGPTQGNNSGITIFDNETVNQDIYVTHTNVEGSGKAGDMNYYIELEQMKIDHTKNMQTTLKAIRGSAVD